MKKILIVLLLSFPSHSKTTSLYDTEDHHYSGACSSITVQNILVDFCAVSDDLSYHIMSFGVPVSQEIKPYFTLLNPETKTAIDFEFTEQDLREVNGTFYNIYYWVMPPIFAELLYEKFTAQFMLYPAGDPLIIEIPKEDKVEFRFIAGFK